VASPISNRTFFLFFFVFFFFHLQFHCICNCLAYKSTTKMFNSLGRGDTGNNEPYKYINTSEYQQVFRLDRIFKRGSEQLKRECKSVDTYMQLREFKLGAGKLVELRILSRGSRLDDKVIHSMECTTMYIH
jgi:hypothetical protein